VQTVSVPVLFDIEPSAHVMQSKQQIGRPFICAFLVPFGQVSEHTALGICQKLFIGIIYIYIHTQTYYIYILFNCWCASCRFQWCQHWTSWPVDIVKHTVGTESIQTPLNFSHFISRVILQPFAKII